MKNQIFKKIQIQNKSKNKKVDNKNEKNIAKNNKIIIPKLKMNLLNLNENEERENEIQTTIPNIILSNNKEKKLILNNQKNYHNKIVNQKYNVIKLEKNIKGEEKICNTDRTTKKDLKKYKTLINFNVNNNKNKTLNQLLLSPKNKIKTKIIVKKNKKSKFSEFEESNLDNTNDNNLQLLSKHKSSQNFRKEIKFTKIKLTKNILNDNNFINISNNKREKTLERRKTQNIIANFYDLNNSNSKSFYKQNKNNSLNLNNKEISRNEKLKKINLKTFDYNKLDIIFEDNNKNKESHHYLENTISAKNKIVKKRKVEEISINDIDKKNKKINTNKLLTKKLNILFDKENQNEKLANTLYKTNTLNQNRKLLENYNSINTNKKININLNKRHKSIDSKSKNNITISTNDNTKIFNKRIEDYLITKELGKGSCAVVKLATHKITKDKFAIKIYTKEFLLDPQKRSVVRNEINILKQLDNEYIMKLYEEIDTPDYLYLVLEYINGIPLIDILKNEKNGFLPEKRAKKLIIQIIKGIIYLHSKNICHRDIKLENILVMKNDTIKIIDFGFGVKCNKDSYHKLFCGTPSYMAPEILNKEKYIPFYCDIWSLGVLFYTMLYGRFPFEYNEKIIIEDYDEKFEKITDITLDFSNEISVSDKIKELFKKIFVIEPKERLKLNEILDILLINDNN